MGNLSNIGRIFYGLAISAMGMLTFYYTDFPYFLLPPNHHWVIGHIILLYISGALLTLAGAFIFFKIKTMSVSLFLGSAFLLVFCFYFIPYEFLASSNYKHFGAWENAAKELTLCGGAFVMAGCFSKEDKNPAIQFLKKLIPLGTVFFSLTIISYGINHFLYAKEAAGYVPSWIPNPVFWIYVTGTALLGSGIAILLKIKTGLAAFLLGAMILIWVIILHIPKSVAAPATDQGGEVSSAFLALAYCGIAFAIAGSEKKRAQ
jgi:uncharacterized membrane protein